MKIRITNNKWELGLSQVNQQIWYKDKIGQVFDAIRCERLYITATQYTYVYYVNDSDFVYMCDCEIIRRREKLERILKDDILL